MPLYHARLEAPDAEHERVEAVLAEHPAGVPGRVERHFRHSQLEAESPAAARRVLERRELKKVLFELPPDELGQNPGDVDLNRLLVHGQEQPWRVVSVKEVK